MQNFLPQSASLTAPINQREPWVLRQRTRDTGVLFLFFSGKKRNQKKPAKGKGFIALPLGTPTRETCERSVLSLLFCHRVGIVTLRHPTARFPASLTRALRWKSVGFCNPKPLEWFPLTP